MKDKSFALIIPTLNRHEYIINFIKCYISLNLDIGIFIGDGSGSSLAATLSSYDADSGNVDLHYFHLPGLHLHKTQRFLVEEVCKLDYYSAAFCGDDDFINPFAAYQMANFLRSHSDFASVQGRAYIGDHPLVASEKFGFHDLTEYWSQPAEGNSKKIIRICNILENYWVPHFSVKRSSDYLSILSNEYVAIEDFSIGEIMQTVNTIALGKSYFCDYLYLIRGAHPFRGFEPPRQCFVNTAENMDLKLFTSAMHKMCNKQSDRKMIDNAFLCYLKKSSEVLPLQQGAINKIMHLISHFLFSPVKAWVPESIIRLTRKCRFPSTKFLDINHLNENELMFIRAVYTGVYKKFAREKKW
jgi:glycosyltransferase domain-containing protein